MTTQTTNRWRYKKEYRQSTGEDSGWNALVAAIVKQAVDDYMIADDMMNGKIKYGSSGIFNAEYTKEEVVKFFKGKWYAEICDIDPKLILRKLGAI